MQAWRRILTRQLIVLRTFLCKGIDDPWERNFVVALLAAGLVVGLWLFTEQVDLVVTVGGVAVLVIGIVGMRAPKETWIRDLAPELIGISIGVMAIDQLYQVRLDQQEKRAIIQQLGSRSNDFALEAARIVVDRGWHTDGSLRNAALASADLQEVDLSRGGLV